MNHLMPYFGLSLGIHLGAACAITGLGMFHSDSSAKTSAMGRPHAITLVIAGSSEPSRAAQKQPVTPPQPVERRPEPLDDETILSPPLCPSPENPLPAASTDSLPCRRGSAGQADEEGALGTLNPYLAHIRQRIERCKKYPPLAHRTGEEGWMLFSLKIDSQGQLRRLALIEKQGSQRLVDAGREAIRNAAPFDCPPAPWKNGLNVRVPIRFTISTL